jgi:hypothetical protein
MFVLQKRTNLLESKLTRAKNKFILFQFYSRPLFLSVIGELLVVLVWIIAFVLTKALDFELF